MVNIQVGPPDAVVAYIRVSTAEQVESRGGLEAQLIAIHAEVARRGWRMVADPFTEDGVSGKSMKGRPELAKALDAVESGVAGTLVVAKLDRLSRSLLDFAAIMERAQRRGWNLVALDLGIDLSTPAGEFLASVMASAAQWERRIISQRTKDALAAKRASGVRLGRPPTIPREVMLRVAKERAGGRTLAAIAEGLDAAGIATVAGGAHWSTSTIRRILESDTLRRYADGDTGAVS